MDQNELKQKETAFRQALENLMNLAKEQNNMISEEQLAESLSNLMLSDEQTQAVKEYLKQNKVGIDNFVDLDDYMTSDEKDYLEAYLLEISSISPISDSEQMEVFLKAIAGEKISIERVTEYYLPKVADIAKLYTGNGVLMEDLIGEGNVALALSMQMLSGAKTIAQVDHIIMSAIMEAMETAITQADQSKKEDNKIISKINKVVEQAKELAEELGRNVSVQEISVETGISNKEILDIIKMTGGSIDFIQSEDDEKNQEE